MKIRRNMRMKKCDVYYIPKDSPMEFLQCSERDCLPSRDDISYTYSPLVFGIPFGKTFLNAQDNADINTKNMREDEQQ